MQIGEEPPCMLELSNPENINLLWPRCQALTKITIFQISPANFKFQLKYTYTAIVHGNTVDRENFIVKKVTWNKSSTHFNFVKAESIVCTSTKELS